MSECDPISSESELQRLQAQSLELYLTLHQLYRYYGRHRIAPHYGEHEVWVQCRTVLEKTNHGPDRHG